MHRANLRVNASTARSRAAHRPRLFTLSHILKWSATQRSNLDLTSHEHSEHARSLDRLVFAHHGRTAPDADLSTARRRARAARRAQLRRWRAQASSARERARPRAGQMETAETAPPAPVPFPLDIGSFSLIYEAPVGERGTSQCVLGLDCSSPHVFPGVVLPNLEPDITRNFIRGSRLNRDVSIEIDTAVGARLLAGHRAPHVPPSEKERRLRARRSAPSTLASATDSSRPRFLERGCHHALMGRHSCTRCARSRVLQMDRSPARTATSVE
jgi:hypothetical protein